MSRRKETVSEFKARMRFYAELTAEFREECEKLMNENTDSYLNAMEECLHEAFDGVPDDVPEPSRLYIDVVQRKALNREMKSDARRTNYVEIKRLRSAIDRLSSALWWGKNIDLSMLGVEYPKSHVPKEGIFPTSPTIATTVTLKCANCKKEFEVYKNSAQGKRGGGFCSTACYGTFLRGMTRPERAKAMAQLGCNKDE